MQRGAPDFSRMSASLAAKIRRQSSELQAMFKALGAVEVDLLSRRRARRLRHLWREVRQWRCGIPAAAGGGWQGRRCHLPARRQRRPGGIAACSEERGLSAREETAPIKVLFYNGSGRDIQLYKLDSEGKRAAQGTIGDEMSFPVLTYVGSPWVIADGSGKCLEIVLPGQHTRYHTVEANGAASGAGGAPHGSPERKRRDAAPVHRGLGRGEPDYDRMTSEVAAQTRRQLPFNQAIVSRLGPLRAMSFRGVSGLGSDVYIAHFANGSAEWRIGLVKDGTIGRIALGPQY